MKTQEIYFDDLNSNMQHRLLDLMGIKNPSEMNWDVLPLTTLPLPEENDELESLKEFGCV